MLPVSAAAKGKGRTAIQRAQNKRICGAQTKRGRICRKEAGWGTDHLGTGRCKNHLGSTSKGAVAAAKEELAGMAVPLPVSPGQAVLGVLQLAAGQLAFCAHKVSELDDKEFWEKTIAGEVPNRWIRLQRSVMHDIEKFSKTAHAMGISEREMALAEAQTLMMGELLEAVVSELGLSAEQRRQMGPAIRKHMAVIEGKAKEKVA